MTLYGTTDTTKLQLSSDTVEGEGERLSSTGDEAVENGETNTTSLLAFYTSHAFFMWNNRSYEFASVLFTASAFPHTLVAASIRGLSAHLASVLFSPSVGQWCGNHASRLRPVQICIVAQRLCIALACCGWMLLVQRTGTDIANGDPEKTKLNGQTRLAVFAGLIVLGMVERLSAVGNMIVVEREWLPLLAEKRSSLLIARVGSPLKPPAATLSISPEEHPLVPRIVSNLHFLNATTKRIDLITKLVAPIAVSTVAIGVKSVHATAIILTATQLISCVVELYLISKVWYSCPALRSPKPSVTFAGSTEIAETSFFPGRLINNLHSTIHSLAMYCKSSACLPSIAYVLEPFSVLTLAGSMSSYLLISGFHLTAITAARAASTTVEIVSTVLTPLIITWLSKRRFRSSHKASNLGPLIQTGLLGLWWHILFLVPATTIFFVLPSTSSSALTVALFTCLVLSRLGPFAYSLVEQQIVQLELTQCERMQFSGVEMALIDLAELARWSMLGIFGEPGQFRWIVAISFVSVAVSVMLFGIWARRQGRELREYGDDEGET